MGGSGNDVVIVDAVRSAIGRRNGTLSKMLATELLGDVLKGLVGRHDIDPMSVDRVVGGNVIQVGNQAANVTRNAWLGAGLPLEVPATTVNVQCGSAQEALSMSHALVGSGLIDLAVACGVETMTRIPQGSNAPTEPDYGQPREGRYADIYDPTTQFEGSERIAESWNLSREDLEVYGKRSQDLAARAWAEDRFKGQIIPIEAPVTDDDGNVTGRKTFDRDEGLRDTTLDGLAGLRTNPRQSDRPSRHTAGTSSQISDGAGAVLIASAAKAEQLGLTPRARIVTSVLVGSDPEHMLTGPIPATRALLERAGLTLDDIDVFEVNEAFASVVLAWAAEIKPDMDKVNPNGGAIAMGHPLGGTGAILVTKALNELERTGGRYGMVAMCCGGGLGTGTIIERI